MEVIDVHYEIGEVDEQGWNPLGFSYETLLDAEISLQRMQNRFPRAFVTEVITKRIGLGGGTC